MLDTPEAAVRSYLAWTSYAYRLGDASVASATMTPDEGVRVDAYTELNRQRGRRIDQALVSFTVSSSRSSSGTATVAAGERWRYSYLMTTGDAAATGPYDASYDTTYTLVRDPKGSWRVDAVAAQALGAVR